MVNRQGGDGHQGNPAAKASAFRAILPTADASDPAALTRTIPRVRLSRMKSLLHLLFVMLVATGTGWAQSPQTAAGELPKILLIGDSISAGYQGRVKKALEGRAVVVKNEGNAEWSGTGVKKIDQYLGTTRCTPKVNINVNKAAPIQT